MNIDQYEGKWKEVKGKAKAKWAKLLDDDILMVEGKTDQLAGLIQKTYGYEKDKANKEAGSFMWDMQKDAWSNQLKGNWHKTQGKLKVQWAKLTDDEVMAAEGNVQSLLGSIQKEYGLEEGDAVTQMRKFFKEIKTEL